MPVGPNPLSVYPIPSQPSMVFLKATVSNPQIEVGDYTYYHSFDDPLSFEQNVRYAFPFIGDRLVIGRFCSVAHGATFILNGGNHLTDTVSSYPLGIFGQGWEHALPDAWPNRGGITIGHDVWIGFEATIMPGVTVGHGAVIAAKSVVTADVPPYAVVAGNPARVIRFRHSEAEIATLLGIAWWNWPIERVSECARVIATGSVTDLERWVSTECDR
ncbi:CatB-related O-acetyltransferase [Salinarimonas soli]|uniref:CatB-related O-acetyltransferase n=1 Tax=Salinarimonas soli TaxID=1638099 RepID=A0A5B2V3X5_9HYPH|nr:CatB-related O-acetyltransferase [Salinarimonas soli]KAA2233155.1 CatB-related O-acetyltransferase [Salinarimonas soli]